MELTRRDTLTALSAFGVGSVAGCTALTDDDETNVDEHAVRTLVAVATAVYPSSVEGIESFVREYTVTRVRDDAAYEAGVADAVARLDAYVEQFYDESYAALPTEERAAVLDQMGVDTAEPVPDGVDHERIRYYLVNELLYAFYTTPTGASLAGLENPPGYPGGTASYRRGPHG